MAENFWYWVALAEFIILAITIGPKFFTALAMLISSWKTHGPERGHVGVIRNLDFVLKGFGHNPVTTFEIHEPNGYVYFGAMDGHAYELYSGARIEYWPDKDHSIANADVQKSIQNDDGTTTRWKEKIEWYPLKKYRILPDLETT